MARVEAVIAANSFKSSAVARASTSIQRNRTRNSNANSTSTMEEGNEEEQRTVVVTVMERSEYVLVLLENIFNCDISSDHREPHGMLEVSLKCAAMGCILSQSKKNKAQKDKALTLTPKA